MHALEFVPIDLSLHEDLCVQFAVDTHVESFGNADRFHETDSKRRQRYRDWLRERLNADPLAAVFVLLESEIIGQLTLGSWKSDPTVGYVNLYYLIPEWRGRGLSTQLEKYVESSMRQMGYRSARLSVSPTNLRALKFYEKNGWKNLGPRLGHPEVHYMEKDFTRSHGP